MAEALTPLVWRRTMQRLAVLPMPARRLLCVIVRQAYQGTLRSKTPGRATMPEIHEACGLDVDELQSLLTILQENGLVSLEGAYPFEEVQLQDQSLDDVGFWQKVLHHCQGTCTPLETILVSLRP